MSQEYIFEFETRTPIRIRRPITREVYEVSETMWRAGKPINEDSLNRACESLGIKVERPTLEDAVQLAKLLEVLCPV